MPDGGRYSGGDDADEYKATGRQPGLFADVVYRRPRPGIGRPSLVARIASWVLR